MDAWELAYLPSLADAELVVPTRQISLAGVPADFGEHRWLTRHVDLWDSLEPITLHREFNWRTEDSSYRCDRLYAGWSNGRERAAIARRLGMRGLRVTVIGFAFWPPDWRPDDRLDVMEGAGCFVHPDFDHQHGRWSRWPEDERGTAVDCH